MSDYGGKRKFSLFARNDAFDPIPTSASISCCSSEAGFCRFQIVTLSRYDAVS
jgi:hypothetical protein